MSTCGTGARISYCLNIISADALLEIKAIRALSVIILTPFSITWSHLPKLHFLSLFIDWRIFENGTEQICTTMSTYASFSPITYFFNPLTPRAAYWRQCLCHHWWRSNKWLDTNPFLEPMLTSHREKAKEQSYVKLLSNLCAFHWNEIAICVFSRLQCVE